MIARCQAIPSSRSPGLKVQKKPPLSFWLEERGWGEVYQAVSRSCSALFSLLVLPFVLRNCEPMVHCFFSLLDALMGNETVHRVVVAVIAQQTSTAFVIPDLKR